MEAAKNTALWKRSKEQKICKETNQKEKLLIEYSLSLVRPPLRTQWILCQYESMPDYY